MTRQSSTWCAHCARSSRTISFELYGEKVDPNLISQSHGKEKEKEEDHYMCLNNNGNSIRPCNNRRAFSFELFGEKIDPNLNQSNHEKEKEYDHNYRFLIGNIDNSLYRSNSMDSLDACSNEPDFMDIGYRSDGLPNGSSHYIHDKKKGLPWTRDEHKSFLIGLEKLGKGDWRGISKKYVQSRTPTQVASHAQKYFIRLKAREKGKGRSSLFDMPKESMRYGNAHKSSTHERSNMVHCGPNMNRGRFYPSNNSSTQHTSQAFFMSQPVSKTDGSASKGKEDVLGTK